VITLGELARLARFCITFPTKHTINKSKIAGIFNMEWHMRLDLIDKPVPEVLTMEAQAVHIQLEPMRI
jgi:hypothetical protein